MNHARNNDMSTILVIDLESTCWEGKPPPGMQSDIIEIGVATLDVATLAQGSVAFSIAVKPERSTISPFCTQLNGWTDEKLQAAKAVGIREAFARLRHDLRAREHPWASWGAYDRNMIEKTAVDFGLPVPTSRQHINAKTLFALVYELPSEIGMDSALKILGWPLEGRHHSGVDDARNIAKILGHLLQRARER